MNEPRLAKQPKPARALVAGPPATPPSRARAWALQAALEVGLVGSPLPTKNGRPVAVDLKSFGFPKKSQRSLASPVRLTSLPAPMTPKGGAPSKLTLDCIS